MSWYGPKIAFVGKLEDGQVDENDHGQKPPELLVLKDITPLEPTII